MNLDSIKNSRLKTILQFSIPSIIAMVLTSPITVADGFFIGNYVGKEGLAAVNLGLPVVYLYLAAGLMVSVGGIAIAGMAYGGGDVQKCSGIFHQTIVTAAAATALLSVAVWLCFEPMLQLLHADAAVAGYFRDYYSILLPELLLMVVNASLGMFIRGEGHPEYFMKVNILNVLLNILPDDLFIRWFGWGVKGIAAASLLAAVAALLCSLHFFWKRAKVYRFGRFQFSAGVLKSTLWNGSSEFVGEMSLSIAMFAYNYVILKWIGVDGLTAFTIVGYLAYLFSMIVTGFGQGASPLISFTYGAGEIRLTSGLRRITNALVTGTGALVLRFVLCALDWYSSLFVRNEAVVQMIRSGAFIYAVSDVQ